MGLLTSLTRTNPGDGQLNVVEPIDHRLLNGSGTLGTNIIALALVRAARPFLVTKLSFYVTVSSGNVDAAIYQSDGATLTRLASSGSTACGTGAAVQTITLAAGVGLAPGIDYYLGLAVDNATASFARYNQAVSNAITTGLMKATGTVAASFPAPSSIALSGLSATTATLWVAGRP